MAEQKIKSVLSIQGELGSSVKNAFTSLGGMTNKVGSQLDALNKRARALRGEIGKGLGGAEATRELAKLENQIGRTTRRLEAMRKLPGNARALGGNISELGRRAFIGASVATAGVGATMKSFADFGDDASDMAASLGIATQRLLAFRYAASTVGLDSAGADKSMLKLADSIQAAKDGSKEATEAFTRLGLDANKLSKLSLDQQMLVVAEAFKRYKGNVNEAVLAQQLFGKGGLKMAGLLKTGAAGIKELAAEAREAGYVLTDEQLEQSGKAAAAFDRLGASLIGARNKIALGMAPAVIDALDTLGKSLRDNKDTFVELGKTVGEITRDALPAFMDCLKLVGSGLRFMKDTIGGKGTAIVGALALLSPVLLPLSMNFFKMAYGIYAALPALATFGRAAVMLIPRVAALGASVIAATWPFLVIGGAVVAFGFAIKKANDLVTQIRSGFDGLRERGLSIPRIFGEIDEAMGILPAGTTKFVGEAVDALFRGFSTVKTIIFDSVSGAFTMLKETLSGWFGWLMDKFNSIGSSVRGMFGSVSPDGGDAQPIDGARAAGGPVTRGLSYLVGERGPEIFTPSTGGNIAANRGGGRGGSRIDNSTYNITINALPGMDLQEIANLVVSRLEGRQAALAGGALYD